MNDQTMTGGGQPAPRGDRAAYPDRETIYFAFFNILCGLLSYSIPADRIAGSLYALARLEVQARRADRKPGQPPADVVDLLIARSDRRKVMSDE